MFAFVPNSIRQFRPLLLLIIIIIIIIHTATVSANSVEFLRFSLSLYAQNKCSVFDFKHTYIFFPPIVVTPNE